jgi:arsenate reductase (glutaredoxin)
MLMQTTCATCASPLGCGVDAKSCWCQSLPSLPATAVDADKACLCNACLKSQLLQHTVMFGIANCDTVKRARAWLAEQGVDYVFWDYKKHAVPADWLHAWLPALGWQNLINTRGTTWRKLDEAERQAVLNDSSALQLMLAQPSVIKRPLMHWRNARGTKNMAAGAAFSNASETLTTPTLSLGFDPAHWNTLL